MHGAVQPPARLASLPAGRPAARFALAAFSFSMHRDAAKDDVRLPTIDLSADAELAIETGASHRLIRGRAPRRVASTPSAIAAGERERTGPDFDRTPRAQLPSFPSFLPPIPRSPPASILHGKHPLQRHLDRSPMQSHGAHACGNNNEVGEAGSSQQ